MATRVGKAGALKRSSCTYIMSQHDLGLLSKDTKQIYPWARSVTDTPCPNCFTCFHLDGQSFKNLLWNFVAYIYIYSYYYIDHITPALYPPFLSPILLVSPLCSPRHFSSTFMSCIHVILCICIKIYNPQMRGSVVLFFQRLALYDYLQ